MLDDPAFVSAQYQSTDPLQARIALHQRFSTNPSPWTHWLFDQIPFVHAGCLLEVGCGSGDLWLENRHRLPVDWTFNLSDLHAAMLDLVRARLQGQSQFHLSRLDAQFLPFASDQFDLVIANYMLYHVADLEETLVELARVLKTDGWLVAATGGPGHMLELRQLMSRFLHGSSFTDEEAKAPLKPPKFNLENGGDLVGGYLQNVEIRLFPNQLLVTEVDPLMAYIRSRFPGRDQGVEENIQLLADYLVDYLAREGAFRISIEAGCVFGRKD